MHKKFILFFLLIFLTVSLYAGNYVIRNYTFDITGKTKEWAVRKLIVPEGRESFSDTKSLLDALDSKRQLLYNKRLFRSVDYAYTETIEDDTTYVDVIYTVVDAKAIFFLPYPKYDSNYGARLGLRFIDSNVLGTFSSFYSVVRVTVMPWDFSTTSYEADLKLSDLKIGQASLSMAFTGTASQTEGLKTYDGSISASDIALFGGPSLAVGFGVKENGSELQYTGSSSLSGLHIGEVALSPSIAVLIYEKSRSESYITPSLTVSNIILGNVKLSFTDTVKLMDSNHFRLDTLTHSTALSFREGVISKYGYGHTFTYKPHLSLQFDNTLSYKASDTTTLYFYENFTFTGSDFFFSAVNTGVGLSQEIKVGEHISLTPTLQQFLRADFSKGENVDWDLYCTFSGSASGDYVNWEGNFRQGVKYSFSVAETWSENYGVRNITGEDNDRLELILFKNIGGWFNPSMRILFNYTRNAVAKKGSITGTDSGSLGEYIRGVRNSTISSDGRDKNMIAFVSNLNLLFVFPLPSFLSSWVDTYANFFADYAVTQLSEVDTPYHYLGIGVEGIGILKDHPNYPVRLSIGMDARKLGDYLKGKTASTDFMEIYFGLDFFF